MNKTVQAREKVYAELYRQRVENRHIYLERKDLEHLADAKQIEAAICYGVEMGHIEKFHGRQFYRLTATGMAYAELNGYVEEE